MFAREKRIAMNEQKIATRYETAILCSYYQNFSGMAKVSKSPQDIYKTMEIKSINEQDKAEEKMGGRRHYKGSMKSRFAQHAEWLESKKAEE